MSTIHLECACPEVKVPCPNDCKGEVMDLNLHHDRCPKEVISCSFREFGCPAELIRQEMVIHENQAIRDHLQLVKTAVAELKRKMNTLEQRPRKPVMICKVEGYASLKATGELWLRPDFETQEHLLNVTIWVGWGYLSIEIFVMDCEHDEELPWPAPGHITIELLNQLSNTKHHRVNYELHPCRSAGYSYTVRIPEFVTCERLESTEDSDCQYLLDDTIYIAITHVDCGTIQ